MTTPQTIPKTETASKIPEGNNSSANSSTRPAAINRNARVSGSIITSLVRTAHAVRQPHTECAGYKITSNFLYNNAIALDLNHLQSCPCRNVTSLGDYVQILIAKASLAGGTQNGCGFADGTEQGRVAFKSIRFFFQDFQAIARRSQNQAVGPGNIGQIMGNG